MPDRFINVQMFGISVVRKSVAADFRHSGKFRHCLTVALRRSQRWKRFVGVARSLSGRTSREKPMLTRSSVADWKELDQTTDPGAFVGYLDAVSSHDAVRAYKQQTYDLLGVRPGDRVPDAGCGTGDDARAIAALVSPGGCVVGIDSSETMIDAARSRSQNHRVPVDFRTGRRAALHGAAGAGLAVALLATTRAPASRPRRRQGQRPGAPRHRITSSSTRE
jgi:SAM-dependent methyltransferase